jgi:hypothetical protein
MQPHTPISLTRIAFPCKRHPTQSHCDLIRQAIVGWGDPEQLTDAEAAQLKRLCVRWFRLDKSTQLQARVWKDAVVFSAQQLEGEYAIIMQNMRYEAPVILYHVDRGHRLIPSDHEALSYLKYVVDLCVDLMMME